MDNKSDYLINDICKFTPLVDIDYSAKKHLIVACFFKINKPYKNFSIYINGLKQIANYLNNGKSKYFDRLRIFIDKNILDDDNIMRIIKSSKYIEPVLFECEKYMESPPKYHIDLFGALVRYFIMFSFPNNDAIDIVLTDLDNPDRFIREFETIGKVADKYIKSGEISKTPILTINNMGNYINFLKTKNIKDYIIAPLTYLYIGYFTPKMFNKIFREIETNDDVGKYGIRYKPFAFGTDELFFNKYMLKNDKILGIFNYYMPFILYYNIGRVIECRYIFASILNYILTGKTKLYTFSNCSLTDFLGIYIKFDKYIYNDISRNILSPKIVTCCERLAIAFNYYTKNIDDIIDINIVDNLKYILDIYNNSFKNILYAICVYNKNTFKLINTRIISHNYKQRHPKYQFTERIHIARTPYSFSSSML